jgi:hypothetical protein
MRLSIKNVSYPADRSPGSMYYLCEGDIEITADKGGIVLREEQIPLVQLAECLENATGGERLDLMFAPDSYTLNPLLKVEDAGDVCRISAVHDGRRTEAFIPSDETRALLTSLVQELDRFTKSRR